MELEGDERLQEVSFKMKESPGCSSNDDYGASKQHAIRPKREGHIAHLTFSRGWLYSFH